MRAQVAAVQLGDALGEVKAETEAAFLAAAADEALEHVWQDLLGDARALVDHLDLAVAGGARLVSADWTAWAARFKL